MIDKYLGSWWSLTGAYLADALSLASGNVTAMTVTAAAGLLMLAAGIILAVTQKATRAWWLIVPAILTLLWPIFILFIEDTIAWIGRIFVSIFGVGALLIWIGLIIGKAPQRLPIWLIGLGLASFVAYFGLVILVPLLL